MPTICYRGCAYIKRDVTFCVSIKFWLMLAFFEVIFHYIPCRPVRPFVPLCRDDGAVANRFLLLAAIKSRLVCPYRLVSVPLTHPLSALGAQRRCVWLLVRWRMGVFFFTNINPCFSLLQIPPFWAHFLLTPIAHSQTPSKACKIT